MDEDPTPNPPSDAESDLAARRKELEREYVEKYRDLKAQDKRRRESLDLEKAEFESYRRSKVKELADREEKVRRTAENKEEKARVTSDSLRELQGLRRQVKDFEAGEWRRKKETAELETKAAVSGMAARAAAGLLGWALAGWLLATAAWLALSWGAARNASLAVAGATLAVVALLAWRRSRLHKSDSAA